MGNNLLHIHPIVLPNQLLRLKLPKGGCNNLLSQNVDLKDFLWVYISMGEQAISLGPELRIRKTPVALIELIEKGTPEKRKEAVKQFMDVLLGDSATITEQNLTTLVKAMKDPEESVVIVADAAVFLISMDYPAKIFPILLREEKDRTGKPAERISDTIDLVYSSSKGFLKKNLRTTAKKHGRTLREMADIREIVNSSTKVSRLPARRGREPQKMRKAA